MESANAPSELAKNEIETLEKIFTAAIETPPGEREELLNRLSPNQRVLARARELLDADSRQVLIDNSLFPNPVEVKPGQSIGQYKLLQEIGQGGMGVVFMAEQSEPVKRKVALKVIKPGVDSREVIARFDVERQALSMMEHPNIASVLEAGTTESGRPYFVMELVKGLPINDYCQRQNFSPRERLELFITVCHAIQHAHQKGIIHRDIKPSNVLVTEYDGQPVAKVIDFGVAKAVSQPLTDLTLFTGFGQVIGTFEYMSPEQSRFNQLDIDTRSDVYSLGVLLYELLTGSTPLSKQRLRSTAWDEMLRIIREEDPPVPSSRISESLRLDADTNRKQIETRKMSRVVRGELDWIVMKSIEKDRNRRYESPGSFAQDIQCYLDGDAVSACPPSAGYRFQKFARRNKPALLTTALVFVTLLAGLLATSWQAVRARQAEVAAVKSAAQAKKAAESERTARESEAALRKKAEAAEAAAEKEAAVVKALNEFIQFDLLDLEDDHLVFAYAQTPDPNLKLVTLLDRAKLRLENISMDQPTTRVRIQLLLAYAFGKVGRFRDSSELLEAIIEENPIKFGVNKQLNIKGLHWPLAVLYMRQDRMDEAQKVFSDILDARRKLLGDSHPDTVQSMINLASTQLKHGKFSEAKALLDEVNTIRSAPNGKGLAQIDFTLKSNLARLYASLGQDHLAESMFQEALEMKLRIAKPTEIQLNQTINAYRLLAAFYANRGWLEKARSTLDAALAQETSRQNGPESNIASINHDLAVISFEQGRYAEAEKLLLKAIKTKEKIDRGQVGLITQYANLGAVYRKLGQFDRSIEVFESTKALRDQHPNSHRTYDALGHLGMALIESGKREEGVELLQSTVTTIAEQNFLDLEWVGIKLAKAYSADGKLDLVMSVVEQQIERLRTGPPMPPHRFAIQLELHGDVLLEAGLWAEAETLLRECLKLRNDNTPNHWRTELAKVKLGSALVGQRKSVEAEELLLHGIQEIDRAWDEIPSKSAISEATDQVLGSYGDTEVPTQIRQVINELSKKLPRTDL